MNLKVATLILFLSFSLINAENTKETENSTNQEEKLNKLDMMDKQSQDFYMAVTGLEKEYLDEQIKRTKEQKEREMLTKQKATNAQGGVITEEQREKDVFNHQNELARIASDFTRTKRLKDLKIKSMYRFNGINYVILLLDDETANRSKQTTEISGNIEGRYMLGDTVFGHKIVDINTRTKSIELFKDLDKISGYTIYLSNYGINLSNLQTIDRNHPRYEQITGNIDKPISTKKSIKNIVQESNSNVNSKNINNECFVIKVNKMNIRDNQNLNSKVIKILEKGDVIKVAISDGSWLNIDTIYYNSKKVVNVNGENNWIFNSTNYLEKIDCK
ncbi:hypothetical protein EI285_04200 [Aliarcobacter skirrowii]|uniref:hypothetical protein n=1 Tax=Aliarcobacter skirrowii TaxID=28200 RepID=UPI000F68557D|nr:hypothetical protein [Aliarcobacter skirrowii]AZL53824.1 hypothetical protein EI285_04200 [Aliarcobacter skirrowii]